MDQGANLQQQSKAYNFDPNNLAPPEVQQQLTALLTWHDDVYRDILKKIETIPGLTDLLDNITNALNACELYFSNTKYWECFLLTDGSASLLEDVYSILAPWLSVRLSFFLSLYNFSSDLPVAHPATSNGSPRRGQQSCDR